MYIDNPLLYLRRKFDIRCYMLTTSQNGISKSYFFEESYIRTSSVLFTLKNLQNKMIHLTNDAVQKRSDDYGKFEGGNKVLSRHFRFPKKISISIWMRITRIKISIGILFLRWKKLLWLRWKRLMVGLILIKKKILLKYFYFSLFNIFIKLISSNEVF